MITIFRRKFLTATALIPLLSACNLSNGYERKKLIKVSAPFGTFNIEVPNFENTKNFVITEFGADPASQVKTSRAIELAIVAANAAGGGSVIVPPGRWPTGKIHLKSNVNFHVAEGAELIFSGDPKDYLPAVHSTWEGVECFNYSPLIYAYNCQNIAISGKGALIATLDVWKEWYARPKEHLDALVDLYYMAYNKVPVKERDMTKGLANLRPQFIQFNRCQNVLMEDIKIVNSAFWVVHPYMSDNLVIRRINIYAHGHNNDGVDPEMCQNFLIENCIFDQGDDAISVKSGRDHDAWAIGRPTKNGVIRNCTIKNGHQLLAVGSELSGGIENIFVDSCKIESIANEKNLTALMNIVFIKTNERRGGYVKNIFVSNIVAENIKEAVIGIDTDVLYQWRTLTPTLTRRLTPISNIHVSNISVEDAKYICQVNASEEMPVKNLTVKNIRAGRISVKSSSVNNVEGFVFQP